MKKLICLIALLMVVGSIAFAFVPETSISTSGYESVFRTNSYDGTSRGAYVNTVAPNFGYIPIIAKTAPATANVQTGTIVLYYDSTTSSIEIRYIAKDNAGTATAGTLF